jgi:hypothetical protein
MKSYTTLRNLYGSLTKDTSTANLTLGDELINDEIRHICSMRDFSFLHKLRTATTVASTQFVNLPYGVDLVESLYVTVSSTRYTPKLLHSREEWDLINTSTSTSDIPEFAFVYNGQIGLYPIPTTAGNTITLNCKVRVIDLNTADITTTTITTLANAGIALTVSAGLTVQMAGWWIRPTFSTTANTGDGLWYELSSVTNATTATLVNPYGGTAIAAGTAASTIAQMPLLPEDFHDTPVFAAAATFWYKEGNTTEGDKFMVKYDRNISTLINDYSSAVSDLVLDSGEERQQINPNLTITI